MSNPDLQILHDALNDLRDGDIDGAAFCSAWRAQEALIKRLPPRYEEVAEDLLAVSKQAACSRKRAAPSVRKICSTIWRSGCTRPKRHCCSHTQFLHYKVDMQHLEFQLQGPYVELNPLLKLAGICDSGGADKVIVAEGHVKVDGRQELRKTCKIAAGPTVALGDVRIRVLPE